MKRMRHNCKVYKPTKEQDKNKENSSERYFEGERQAQDLEKYGMKGQAKPMISMHTKPTHHKLTTKDM